MACFSAMPPPARRGPGRSGWRAARAAAGWWGQANRSRPGPSDTAARHPAGRLQAGVRLPAPLIRRQRFRILQLRENLDMTFPSSGSLSVRTTKASRLLPAPAGFRLMHA